ncbi:hypothetical protein [Mumia flava]|nr:hypothetical protein [Mumia flava]
MNETNAAHRPPRPPAEVAGDEVLTIDCASCLARPQACGDCVVTALLGPPSHLEMDADETAALDALSSAGLLPPLRLVTPTDSRADPPPP